MESTPGRAGHAQHQERNADEDSPYQMLPGETALPQQGRSNRGWRGGGDTGRPWLGKLFERVTEAVGATKELLYDGDLRKKAVPYVISEGSKALQEIHKGLKENAQAFREQVQQGVAMMNRTQIQALMARLERTMSEFQHRRQLAEHRRRTVDVQVGQQVFESVPQEMRTRLWYALLEHPELMLMLRPVCAGKQYANHLSELTGGSPADTLLLPPSPPPPQSAPAPPSVQTPPAQQQQQQSPDISDLLGLDSPPAASTSQPAAGSEASQQGEQAPSTPPRAPAPVSAQGSQAAQGSASQGLSAPGPAARPSPVSGARHAEDPEDQVLRMLDDARQRQNSKDLNTSLRGGSGTTPSQSGGGGKVAGLVQRLVTAVDRKRDGRAASTDGTQLSQDLVSDGSPFSSTTAARVAATPASNTQPLLFDISGSPLVGADAGAPDAEWELIDDDGLSAAVRQQSEAACKQLLQRLHRQAAASGSPLSMLWVSMLSVPWVPGEGLQHAMSVDCRYKMLNEMTAGQEEVDDIIMRDINRTFPEHPQFSVEAGQMALFRVLKAYSLHDLEVGYCQGMAFAAGAALMYLPEEPAFRLYCRLMDCTDGANLRRLYLPGLNELKAELARFDRLLSCTQPALQAHLEAYGIPPVLYVSQWLMTAFAAPFPPSFCAQLIDIMLQDGHDAILMYCSLAIMDELADTLLQMEDFEQLLTYIKVTPIEWDQAQLRKVLQRALNHPAAYIDEPAVTTPPVPAASASPAPQQQSPGAPSSTNTAAAADLLNLDNEFAQMVLDLGLLMPSASNNSLKASGSSGLLAAQP